MIAIKLSHGKLAQRAASPYPPRVTELDRQFRAVLRPLGRTITRYRMIADGDRILVAVSGGKDSSALLYVLRHLQARAPVRFALAAVTVDGGWGGHPIAKLQRFCEALDVPLEVRQADIVSAVVERVPEDDTPCPLCARMRRGTIYRAAREGGFRTVALGHHADDLVETLLLNQIFNGQLKAMPPVLRSDDGVTTVIRPMLMIEEATIRAFAHGAGLPSVPCQCLGAGNNTLRRPQIKELVTDLEERFPGARRNLAGASGRLHPRHLTDERWLPLDEEPAASPSGKRPPPPPAPGELAEQLAG